ncbi:MAG: hypothetical protein AB7E84_12060 [Xanthobacteraceae bacterium]
MFLGHPILLAVGGAAALIDPGTVGPTLCQGSPMPWVVSARAHNYH